MSGILTRSGLRAFATQALTVVNNVAKQQFTITLPSASSEPAVLAYEIVDKNNIIFHSTDVPSIYQGKGVGKKLAQYAFQHAVDNNYKIICKCHFLCEYYEKNKDKFKTLKVKLEPDETK